MLKSNQLHCTSNIQSTTHLKNIEQSQQSTHSHPTYRNQPTNDYQQNIDHQCSQHSQTDNSTQQLRHFRTQTEGAQTNALNEQSICSTYFQLHNNSSMQCDASSAKKELSSKAKGNQCQQKLSKQSVVTSYANKSPTNINVPTSIILPSTRNSNVFLKSELLSNSSAIFHPCPTILSPAQNQRLLNCIKNKFSPLQQKNRCLLPRRDVTVAANSHLTKVSDDVSIIKEKVNNKKSQIKTIRNQSLSECSSKLPNSMIVPVTFKRKPLFSDQKSKQNEESSIISRTNNPHLISMHQNFQKLAESIKAAQKKGGGKRIHKLKRHRTKKCSFPTQVSGLDNDILFSTLPTIPRGSCEQRCLETWKKAKNMLDYEINHSQNSKCQLNTDNNENEISLASNNTIAASNNSKFKSISGDYILKPIDHNPIENVAFPKLSKYINMFTSPTEVKAENASFQSMLLESLRDGPLDNVLAEKEKTDEEWCALNAKIRRRFNHKKLVELGKK